MSCQEAFKPLLNLRNLNHPMTGSSEVPLCSCGEVLPPSSGTHICVLVFVDSVEVEGLVVDEELRAGDIDGADADWESVHILICCSRSGCHHMDLDI